MHSTEAPTHHYLWLTSSNSVIDGASNGGAKYSHMYSETPRAHRSAALPEKPAPCLTLVISGAKKKKVPPVV